MSKFFNDLMGYDLSRKEITNLEIRTEGWIAGLQLVALALQRCPNSHDQIVAITGSHHHLIDYLVDEVMSQHSEEVKSFLLCTSILERFNASLCCALLHKPIGKEMLRTLEKARLFLVPLDDECNWYRYHRLFADFLRQRLVETQPEILSGLYQRASDWYEAQGMIEDAIEYAHAGNDVIRAAKLLDQHIESYGHNGEVMKVLQWIDRLPLEVRRRFPRLCIYEARVLQFEHRLGAVQRPLEFTEDHLLGSTGASDSFTANQIIGHSTAKAGDVLVEPLGEREIQVLRLLAARFTYKEIAYELCLSINTIKWYAKIVYGKLGVDRKDKAAARARELCIL
jgi:LuxR family maltose regulon positive regulatory protein